MTSRQLSYDDLLLAEDCLTHLPEKDSDGVQISILALQHLKQLMKQDLSRNELVKYLRLQMGIDPKSEKLKDNPLSNQLPGSAIFRR